jgi:hypothetical protein
MGPVALTTSHHSQTLSLTSPTSSSLSVGIVCLGIKSHAVFLFLFFSLPKATWLSFPTHLTHLTWPPETFLRFHHLRYSHLDTNYVIEAELQAVLNILTECDFQNAFENSISAGNNAYAWKGTTLRVMVASGPKSLLSPGDTTSPIKYRQQWYLET